MPVTVFIPTAYPDQPERRFWWDRLYAAIWNFSSSHVDTPIGRLALGSDQQRSRAFRALRDYVKELPHDSATEVIDKIVDQQQSPVPASSVLSWDRLRTLANQGVTLAPHTQTHPLLTRVPIAQARQEVVGSRDDVQREIGSVLPVFAYPGGQCNAAVKQMMQQEGFELAFTVQRGINHLPSADWLSLNRINVGQQTTPQILKAQLVAGWWKNRMKNGRVGSVTHPQKD